MDHQTAQQPEGFSWATTHPAPARGLGQPTAGDPGSSAKAGPIEHKFGPLLKFGQAFPNEPIVCVPRFTAQQITQMTAICVGDSSWKLDPVKEAVSKESGSNHARHYFDEMQKQCPLFERHYDWGSTLKDQFSKKGEMHCRGMITAVREVPLTKTYDLALVNWQPNEVYQQLWFQRRKQPRPLNKAVIDKEVDMFCHLLRERVTYAVVMVGARTEIWFKYHQMGMFEWEELIIYVRARFHKNGFKTFFAEHIWNQVQLQGVHAMNLQRNKAWLTAKFLEACRYAEPVSFSAEDAR